MMSVRKIKTDVYAVGAIDWDRRLFDALIPLPEGTTYNSYLVKGGEKTMLIETVDPTMTHVLLGNLKELGVDSIDYVVANHAEQDHSGSLPVVLDAFPMAQLVCSNKCKPMLIDLLAIPEERFHTVENGATLELGGKSLQFLYTPWVHWPETMVTYLKEDRILFSCDFLGAHLASSDLFVDDKAALHIAAKRYFGEIMMPFRAAIQNNLDKIRGLEIDIVAPSHGPLYNKPRTIIESYRDWADPEPKNLVVIPYVTMHGSTKLMVDRLVGALIDQGVTVEQFDLTSVDLGELGIGLVDAATIVLGAPTVLMGAHPLALYAAHLANALRPKLRFVSLIGSYGWGTKVVEQVSGILTNLKVEVIEPVIVKGAPTQETFAALDRLAGEIAAKHRENGFKAYSD